MSNPIKRDSDIAILLTGTITPNGTSNTALQDPVSREQQYIDAIEYYLKETDLKIVFCENSGKNIFHKINSGKKMTRLECIAFDGNNYDRNIGKGYGEAAIIKHALENSEFLKNAGWLFKVTGRVKITNIKKLIPQKMCKSRNTIGAECWGDKWMHSVCFFCNKDWLYATVNNYGTRLVDDAFNFQTMLYDAVIETKDINIVSIHPYIDGISGKTGEPYVNNHIFQRKFDNYTGLKGIYYARDEKLRFTYCYIGRLFYRLLVKMFLV